MVDQPSKPPVKHKKCFGQAYSDEKHSLACSFCHEMAACVDSRFKEIGSQVSDLVKKVQNASK